MASNVIYPPIVESYMPAFKAKSKTCRIYFSLSKFNDLSPFYNDVEKKYHIYVHVSVLKHDTGMNVVKRTGVCRTGIILNKEATLEKDASNLYYIEVKSSELDSQVGSYSGWIPGWLYKVQIRLSSKKYISGNQEEWLNNNANSFSEWSTVCIVKAIGEINYKIPFFGIDTSKSKNKINNSNTIYTEYNFTTLQLFGSFDRKEDKSELIHSYNFILYDNDNNIIENSGDIYINKNDINIDSFSYIFKTEFEENKIYKLAFKYITINGYEDGFYKWGDTFDNRYTFECSNELIKEAPCRLLTIENDFDGLMEDISSLDLEEDEGRVALKFYTPNDHHYSGNLCIRRSDSRSDFKIWEDVYICPITNSFINDIPVFYDYTIESGVFYSYGVQEIDVEGDVKDETVNIKDVQKYTRSKLEVMNYKILRNFNYSFLLGKDNQQLKLMFDNIMGTFKYQIYDTKIDPINAKYSTIVRNTATYYRTFPINGLISFWMDENKLFCNKRVVYKYEDVIDLYDQYNTDNNITQYDYIYERDFRNKVLEFLQDGELKLFKSPTEGNIIVRLMDVNCIPNQSLDRMLYSFSTTAYEMADNTMENYLKYGFYKLNDLLTRFITYETRIGQLKGNFATTSNIISSILYKYDTERMDPKSKGLRTKVKKIHHLKITFEDQPLRILNNQGKLCLGNNISIGDSQGDTIITIYAGPTKLDPESIINVYSSNRIYEFDDNIIFGNSKNGLTELQLLGPESEDGKYYVNGKAVTGTSDDPVRTSATIDFLYDVELEIYKGKKVKNRKLVKGLGQIFQECSPEFNLYNIIYAKYYLESDTQFERLSSITSIEIEANPGTVFAIKDNEDSFAEPHVIGATGILRLYDIENIIGLSYLGIQNSKTGTIEQKNADVIVNYTYRAIKGDYVKETG